MFADFIKSLFQENPEPLSDSEARIPLTALLVRIARSDNDYSASEMIRIEEIAQNRFGPMPNNSNPKRPIPSALPAPSRMPSPTRRVSA